MAKYLEEGENLSQCKNNDSSNKPSIHQNILTALDLRINIYTLFLSASGELPPDQPQQPRGGGLLHPGHQPLARSECGEESSRAAILTQVLRVEMRALVMQNTKENAIVYI